MIREFHWLVAVLQSEMFDGFGKEEIRLDLPDTRLLMRQSSDVIFGVERGVLSTTETPPPTHTHTQVSCFSTDFAHWLAFCALHLANVLPPVGSVLNSFSFPALFFAFF